jgi:maltooligosyltrehalose synthase
MLAEWTNGRLKLHVIRSLLHLRRELSGLFANGSYVPLAASGARAVHVVAWSRRHGPDGVIAVIPRLMLEDAGPGLSPTGSRVWGDTACLLPKGAPRSYVDVFTGRSVTATRGRIEVGDALAQLPVAVLRVTG